VRELILRLARTELPEEVANVMTLLFGGVLAVALGRVVGADQPSWLDAPSYYCGVIGVIVSTAFGALSYFAAPFVRKGTSFLSFSIWLTLCGGLSYAVLLLSARSFALGCAVGVSMLFLLFVYFHVSGMWRTCSPPERSSYEAGGFELGIRALAVALVILSSIAVVTLSMLSIVGGGASLTVRVGTGLHIGPFLLWSLLASLAGSYQGV